MQKKIDTLSRMTQILKDVIQNKVNNFFFTCLLKSSLLLKKGLCILPVHLSSVLFSIYFIVLKIEKLEFLLKNVLETLASEGVLRLFYRFFNSWTFSWKSLYIICLFYITGSHHCSSPTTLFTRLHSSWSGISGESCHLYSICYSEYQLNLVSLFILNLICIWSCSTGKKKMRSWCLGSVLFFRNNFRSC